MEEAVSRQVSEEQALMAPEERQRQKVVEQLVLMFPNLNERRPRQHQY